MNSRTGRTTAQTAAVSSPSQPGTPRVVLPPLPRRPAPYPRLTRQQVPALRRQMVPVFRRPEPALVTEALALPDAPAFGTSPYVARSREKMQIVEINLKDFKDTLGPA